MAHEQMTQEQWIDRCYRSGHRYPGETIQFNDHDRDGTVTAWVQCNNGNTCFIGSYFTKDHPRHGNSIKAGTGWIYP